MGVTPVAALLLRWQEARAGRGVVLRPSWGSKLLLAGVLITQAVAVDAARDPGPGQSASDAWETAAVISLVAWCCYQFAFRCRVEMREDRMDVVNPFTTYRIPRGALVECRVTPTGGLLVQTRYGRRIPVSAYQGSLIATLRGREGAVWRAKARIDEWSSEGVDVNADATTRNASRLQPFPLLVFLSLDAVVAFWR